MRQNTDPLHAFRGRLRATRLVIAAERGARAFWPLSALALLAYAAGRFGAVAYLADLVGLWVVLGGLAVLALGLVAYGARGFRWPSRGDAIARLDQTTARRVLSTLSDRPAMPTDAAQAAVWQAHRARVEQAARDVAVPTPDLQVSRQDRYALRLVAAVAAMAALIFVQDSGFGPLTRNTGSAQAAGPSFEAWATPPAYTGLSTIYLTERVAADAVLRLPIGTEIALRAYGDDFALDHSVADAGALREVAPGLNDARLVLERDGQINLSRGGAQLASWSFSVSEDAAPSIRFNGEVGRARAGATEIPYVIADDFDVSVAHVVIERDLDATERRFGLIVDPMPRPELSVEIPLPARSGGDIDDVMTRDFSTHPFAGLPVRMVLQATDGAGQIGRSAVLQVVLPQRSFYDPFSRAIVEQRRDLLWSPEGNLHRMRQLLRAVSYMPDDMDTPEGVTNALRAAIDAVDEARVDGLTAEETDALAEQLWDLALLIEDGRLGDAAAELRRAQERLSQALQDGASDAEIAELMEDLRAAMREYMRQMAEEMRNDPNAQDQAGQDGEGMDMSQQDIQDLMDRIQELSENGQREEAQRLLDQLAQLMENMQMSMNGQGQGEGMENPGGEGGQGGEGREGVEDTLRQQQDLADRSFEELQRQFREGMGTRAPDGEGLEGLADTQEALRDLLDQGDNGEGSAEAQEQLDEAERNMADARDALERGDGRRALDSQAQAMDALREALRALDEQQAGDTAEARQGETSSDSDQQAESRDPLGRPTQNGRAVDGGENVVPDGGSIGSARDLLDEIRRRSGEQARTAEERDYLRRLLDRF